MGGCDWNVLRRCMVRDLSDRQLQILKLLDAGHDHPAVAKALWLGLNTVYSHTKVIRRYFGVHTTEAAVAKAKLWDVI